MSLLAARLNSECLKGLSHSGMVTVHAGQRTWDLIPSGLFLERSGLISVSEG